MKVNDPVCGMTIEHSDEAAVSSFKGTTYYFCSSSYKEDFDKDPEAFIEGKAVSALKTKEPEYGEMFTCPMHPEVRQAGPGACPKCGMLLEPVEPIMASSKIEWTCPMHPEIVRDAPGSCPICGMALEPKTISAQEETNPELIDMTRRFKVSTVLTIPLMYITMGGYFPAISPEKFVPMEMLKVAGTDPGDSRCALGRLAVLRARVEVDNFLEPQHVHTHRPRRCHFLCL